MTPDRSFRQRYVMYDVSNEWGVQKKRHWLCLCSVPTYHCLLTSTVSTYSWRSTDTSPFLDSIVGELVYEGQSISFRKREMIAIAAGRMAGRIPSEVWVHDLQDYVPSWRHKLEESVQALCNAATIYSRKGFNSIFLSVWTSEKEKKTLKCRLILTLSKSKANFDWKTKFGKISK